MSPTSRSIHDISARGAAWALRAMVVGQVDVNMDDKVSHVTLPLCSVLLTHTMVACVCPLV
jgi:hypothetical protein